MIRLIPPVTPQASPYAAVYEFNWMSASGTACFLAAIATAILSAGEPESVRHTPTSDLQQLALPRPRSRACSAWPI